MEAIAHFLLLAAFAAVVMRRRGVGIVLFLCALIFTLVIFRIHVSDRLPLNF